MPYRLSGNCVEVHKDGRWRLLKRHQSAEKARRHLAALKINVPEAKLGLIRKAKMVAANAPMEEKVRRVRDPRYWGGAPVGTPIVPGMKRTSPARVSAVGKKPGSTGLPLESFRTLRRNAKTASDELDAQGMHPEHPLRDVITSRKYDFVGLHRDADGKIDGAIGYDLDRILRQASITELRVVESSRGKGVGTDLLRHVAQETQKLPRPQTYSMTVYGSLGSAIAFYMKNGADVYNPNMPLPEWSPEKVQRLARGEKLEPGEWNYANLPVAPELRKPPTTDELMTARPEPKSWRESLHPRDDDGRFTDGTHMGDTSAMADAIDATNANAEIVDEYTPLSDDERAAALERIAARRRRLEATRARRKIGERQSQLGTSMEDDDLESEPEDEIEYEPDEDTAPKPFKPRTLARAHGGRVEHVLATGMRTLCGKDAKPMARFKPSERGQDSKVRPLCSDCRDILRAARQVKHLPGQHNQQDHAGPDISARGILDFAQELADMDVSAQSLYDAGDELSSAQNSGDRNRIDRAYQAVYDALDEVMVGPRHPNLGSRLDSFQQAITHRETKDIHTGSVSGTTTLGFGKMQRDKLVGRQYRPGHRPATRAALIARSGKRRQRKRRERRESKGMEFKAHRGPVVRHVRDPEYWDQPYGAVIVRGTVLPHVGPQPLEESEVWAGITWDKYTGADGTEWMVADISPPGGKADWVAMTRHQFDKWSGENIADIEKMPKLRFNDPARSKVQLQASLLKKMNTQSKVKQARDGFRFATDDEAKEVGASTAAFTDIQIPEDPDSPIKWIGYSKSNRAVATTRKVDAESETDARKFHRIAALSTQIHKLERTLGRDAQTDDAALAVLIMRLTGQRHGGGEHGSGKGKTYATTTLLRKHVSIDSQGYVRFNYYGKNKEHIKVKSNDPDLVRAMKKRMRGKQPSDRLFPNLTQAKTTTYFRGKVGKYPPSVTGEHSNFKIHDLRTLYANEMANEFLSQVRRKPKSEAQFRKLVERISTQVAPLMGHTTVKKGKEVPNWTTTRNSYINPTVWDVLEPHPAWLKGWGKAGEKLEATAHQIREGELE